MKTLTKAEQKLQIKMKEDLHTAVISTIDHMLDVTKAFRNPAYMALNSEVQTTILITHIETNPVYMSLCESINHMDGNSDLMCQWLEEDEPQDAEQVMVELLDAYLSSSPVFIRSMSDWIKEHFGELINADLFIERFVQSYHMDKYQDSELTWMDEV